MSKAHRRKTPPHYGNSRRAERDDYDFKLVRPSGPGESYKVQAVLDIDSTYRFGSDEDSLFDISSVLGNDNGKFCWGRPGFEERAALDKLELKLDDITGSFILTGKLANRLGEYVETSINIDDKLELDEYTHPESWETFYRVQERKSRKQRTIVMCFDGTSNHFSEKNTNVVKFMELLIKDDPRQIVYYQTGVGTYSHPSIISATGQRIAEMMDKGIAWYLYQHIIDGYKFLMQTYQADDKIVIIGFSRGAFTARALAGMLHCVGLLPKHNAEHAPFAYEIYRYSRDYTSNPPPADEYGKVLIGDGVEFPTTGSRPQDVNPADFKRAFCIPVVVDFVGVWDTVASVVLFASAEKFVVLLIPWSKESAIPPLFGVRKAQKISKSSLEHSADQMVLAIRQENHLLKSHLSASKRVFDDEETSVGLLK